MNKKLVLFDCDGTLTETKSGATFRKSAADWAWLPGRVEHIKQLRQAGVQVAVCTNQGGVAFGYMPERDIHAELTRMCQEASIPVAGLYVCYNHPAAKIERYRYADVRRKPGCGMLLEAMAECSASPSETLMVGDMEDDRRAAEAAGCDFMWSWDYFQDKEKH